MFADIDEGLVRQVFYNIILNGCQSVAENGENGVVEIGAQNKPEMRLGKVIPFVEVTIKDNGPGIKKGNLPKIFDPFFTTKAKGNGLGLSAAYSIIANHDGTIRVESEEGAGTIFTVRIPAVTQSIATQKDMGSVTAFIGGVGKIRVLWLDDEPFITKMAESMLSSFGYYVTSTTSSKAVLEFFRESVEEGRVYDIVVLDLNIKGGLGGKEVIREMQKRCPEITAVASSGYYDDPVMSDPCSYGFKYALKKPYTTEELHCALQVALRSSGR